MSILSTFAQTMANQAFSIIGDESLTIGAAVIPCVFAEIEDSKDFSTGGFDPVKRLQAVCRSADLPAGSLLKKAATARSVQMRVDSVRKGADFTTIILEQIEKA